MILVDKVRSYLLSPLWKAALPYLPQIIPAVVSVEYLWINPFLEENVANVQCPVVPVLQTIQLSFGQKIKDISCYLVPMCGRWAGRWFSRSSTER